VSFFAKDSEDKTTDINSSSTHTKDANHASKRTETSHDVNNIEPNHLENGSNSGSIDTDPHKLPTSAPQIGEQCPCAQSSEGACAGDGALGGSPSRRRSVNVLDLLAKFDRVEVVKQSMRADTIRKGETSARSKNVTCLEAASRDGKSDGKTAGSEFVDGSAVVCRADAGQGQHLNTDLSVTLADGDTKASSCSLKSDKETLAEKTKKDTLADMRGIEAPVSDALLRVLPKVLAHRELARILVLLHGDSAQEAARRPSLWDLISEKGYHNKDCLHG
jgi:hypothetical protein